MLAIYEFISKNRRRENYNENENEKMTLKINTGNPESYLEHCQAPVESALQMKNLREKDAYKS